MHGLNRVFDQTCETNHRCRKRLIHSSLATYRRAADVASTTLAPVAVLCALFAGLWLGFQLSKVDDMCSVGRESLHIGAFMIGSACERTLSGMPMSTEQNRSIVLCSDFS